MGNLGSPLGDLGSPFGVMKSIARFGLSIVYVLGPIGNLLGPHFQKSVSPPLGSPLAPPRVFEVDLMSGITSQPTRMAMNDAALLSFPIPRGIYDPQQ